MLKPYRKVPSAPPRSKATDQENYKPKWSIGDKLSALGIAVAMLSSVLAQWNQVEASQDTAKAIRGIEEIANSMRQQARAIAAERPAVERQANAAADSAQAAKTTASLARGQTGAIVKQADALISSANATIVAAGAQLTSAQANTRTAEAGAKAANEQLKSATLLAATRVPFAKLTSVELLNWVAASQNSTVKVSIRPVITNAGGGTLIPINVSFGIIVVDFVPKIPPATQRSFGGNEISVPPGTNYSPSKNFEYSFSKSDFEAIANKKKGIMVWGKIEYTDTPGNRYQTCYLDTVSIPTNEDAGGDVSSLINSAYQCGAGQN